MITLASALPFSFEKPAWLWLVLLVPILVLVARRSLSGLDPSRRWLAVGLRGSVIILLACCLAGVRHVRHGDDLTVIFLMDRSHSVEPLLAHQEQFIIESTRHMPENDRVGLIDFARYAFLQQLPMKGGYYVPPGRLPAMPQTDRTDIASAIRLAMAMFPYDTAKRIVLLSDGNDNMGDVLGEARRAHADGIPIDVVPMSYRHRNEVQFERLIAPAHAELGEQVPLRMVIRSHRRTAGTLSIHQNGRRVALPPQEAHVELEPGTNTFYIKRPANTNGTQIFEASIAVDDASMDAVARNNSAGAFTFVSTAGSVLLITADPSYDQALLEALRSENVPVRMTSVDELSSFGLLRMMDHSTIILANIPAAAFTDAQQRELAVYVRDLGGGLIMLGGDDGFGAGGWIGSPIEEVMPVSFEIKHKRVIPRGALVLIMHSCEIARGNYWAKEMAKRSVDTISSQDYIGVVAFTFRPGGHNWEVPLDLATNKAAVKARIDRMQIGDMPDFGASLEMAYKALMYGRGKDAAQRHIIILSDGDAAAPSGALIQRLKDARITVSTIAIGWGMHVMERTMRLIASATGGTYYAARNPRQLPQIYVKESKVVRRSLIIDEPFRPQVVSGFSELLGPMDEPGKLLPILGGMVLTSAKPDPNVLVAVARITDDGEDPVLAHWQYGLGKAVVFTSGYWPVWGEAWTNWDRFAKFWTQTVRWTMRQDAPADFETHTKIVGNQGIISVDALDIDARYLNNLRLVGTMIGPDSRAIPIEFTQNGPGNYQARFDTPESGQYLASIRVHDREGRSQGVIRTGLSVPFSPEYRDLGPDESLLRRVADITGGRWFDTGQEPGGVFRHDVPPVKAIQPAWDWVLAWLWLPLFLVDVAARRLASRLAFSIAVEGVVLAVLWFGVGLIHAPWWGKLGAVLLAEIIGWGIRFRHIGPLFDFMTHSVTALAHAGDRSAASLEQLRGARERVREDLAGEGPAPFDASASATAGRRHGPAGRRIDAAGDGSETDAGDLSDALSGAQPDGAGERPGATRPAESGKDSDATADDEATTSRLLRARRRRQKDE